MPVARVELPDGRVARLEVPEGTTPQQVESFVFEQMNAKSAPKAPATPQPDLATPSKPNALVRIGRGMSDLTEGVKQGYLNIKDWATGGNEAAAYTKEKDEDIALYDRGRGKDAGIDWWRLGGNVAATLPAVAVPSGASMNLLTRMVSGAASGAAASGAMYTPENESKVSQVVGGAVAGAAAPAVFQGVKNAAGKLLDFVRPNVSVTVPQQAEPIVRELKIKLQQQGVDWNKLTNQVRSSLTEDAARTLNAGGTLDDVMLQRKALIESVGAKPTRASVSRAPRDWQEEKNLRGIAGVGDDIVTREQTNAAAMQDYLQKLRARAGGAASTELEAGESAVGAIKAIDKAKKEAVDELYGMARDHVGRAAPMDSKGFSDAANKVLDEQMLGAYLPGEARQILNDIALGKVPFNVNTAVQYDSILSAAQRTAGKGSPQALAIGKVRDALNNSAIADNVGEDAKKAFDTARAAAAKRFAEREASSGISAAVDDVAPDKFVQKFIIGAPVKDMKTTLAELRRSPQGVYAIRDVKGTVLDNLLLKATGATNADDLAGKPFSGVRFGKALDAIEPEKLHALFSPAEMESLRTLQKASKLLTEEVPFSDVNHSKTAAAMANLLQKIGNTPLLGQIVSPIIGTAKIGMDWVKDANARKQVAEILIGSAGKAGERAALPPGRFERFAPAGAAVVATDAGQRTDQ